MYFEIHIDWNKSIILPMTKENSAAVDAIFGTAAAVFRREYERGIGEGLVAERDWKPMVHLIRTDEFLTRRNIGGEIIQYKETMETVKDEAA